MSIRNNNQGSIVKPGFNALGAQTSVTTYYPYLYSWGTNSTGQLGLGNTTYYSSPKQVGSLSTWSSIDGGSQYSAAVKTDGTLWSWGQGTSGQLGLNNLTSYSSPKQVGALTNWVSVACGSGHSIAIKTDGTLWSWGGNGFGQLGIGNTVDNSSPVQVGALTAWATVGVGQTYSMAIKTDGTLWTWGRNSLGQLGFNNTTNYSSPKQVGALTDWLKVVGGVYANVMMLKTDGTLWSCGWGGIGQLGLNNVTSYSSPKQVGSLTTWKNISLGYATALAIQTNGTLWSWGQNNFGQLGLGNTTYKSSPTQVGALTNWLELAAGGYYYAGCVKTDGTLWTWGANNNGLLGLGNTTAYSSPKQVGGLTTWIKLAFATASTNGSTLALLY